MDFSDYEAVQKKCRMRSAQWGVRNPPSVACEGAQVAKKRAARAARSVGVKTKAGLFLIPTVFFDELLQLGLGFGVVGDDVPTGQVTGHIPEMF